jgi:hypothetical protein
MYRQLISVSVLAAFVVAQVAALPHGHAQDSPKGHDDTPHIHLPGANSSHEHGHTHPHAAGHVHRHAGPVEKHDNARAECGLSGVADHDANAIYLPPSVSLATSSSADPIQLTPTLALWHSIDTGLLTHSVAASGIDALRPPDEHAPCCALYLALRALRI